MNALQSSAMVLFMWIVVGAIIAADVFETGHEICALILMVAIQFMMILGARDTNGGAR